MKTKAPKPTPEDPAIKSARDREERRADAAFIENTTGLLDEEQRKRVRRFGKRATAARATTGASPSSGGQSSGASSGGSSGGGSFDPGAYGGGGGSFDSGDTSFNSRSF